MAGPCLSVSRPSAALLVIGALNLIVGLTPDLHPFFAGTYFPKGQFRQILEKLADLYVLTVQTYIEF